MSTQFEPLLAFIRQPESGGDYDIVWGGIDRKDRPPKRLTTMTIGEVLAWQDSIDARYRSEAAGAYQILEDTLRDIYRPAGLGEDEVFDRATQDALAIHLLRRRGLDDFLAGRMSRDEFCNSLAKEWASLPVVTGSKRGQSYYGGDGLNAAHVGVSEFRSAVQAIRAPSPQPQPEQTSKGKGSETMIGTPALAARIILYLISGNVGLSGIDVNVDAGTITVQLESLLNVFAGGGLLGGTLGWRKIAKTLGGKL